MEGKEKLELFYTEQGTDGFMLIEIDEHNKEFKIYNLTGEDIEDIDPDLYTFVSPIIMDAIILGLKELQYVIID